jgi:hypothetical protein
MGNLPITRPQNRLMIRQTTARKDGKKTEKRWKKDQRKKQRSAD